VEEAIELARHAALTAAVAAESETSEIIRRRLYEWDENAVTADGRVLLTREAHSAAAGEPRIDVKADDVGEFGDGLAGGGGGIRTLGPPRPVSTARAVLEKPR